LPWGQAPIPHTATFRNFYIAEGLPWAVPLLVARRDELSVEREHRGDHVDGKSIPGCV